MHIEFKPASTANYRPGRLKPIAFIVIHYTANNGDTAKNNADYFAREDVGASAHYFVDEGATVWQSVRDGDAAWHCGGTTYRHPTCRNDTSLGVELCSRRGENGAFYFREATVRNAVTLVRELMAKYGVPPENVLRHYDVTGKNCPAPFVEAPAEWAAFKALLAPEKEEDMPEFKDTTVTVGTATVAAKLIGGTTYVPIREIVAALTPLVRVEWDAETKTVRLEL